jgi:hypothetical protein
MARFYVSLYGAGIRVSYDYSTCPYTASSIWYVPNTILLQNQ